ncbi:hypothetical protein ONR57_04475 [Hoyosella sp. YIM 151337]|uniref:hypothetical protein n=1 Tax=Hoyosella sp. YIM 151337 TaxID=2992742 RepID=UPI002235A74A|nr:hypothetical protein [Hoyosella sp. YIM 151337]MCW4352557.1 hypothetical protein [Hoyosella sp. YIM 151337]
MSVTPPKPPEPPGAPTRLGKVQLLWFTTFGAFLTFCLLVTTQLDDVLAVAEEAERRRTAQLPDSAGTTDIAHAVEVALLSIGAAGIAIVLLQLVALRSLLQRHAKARIALTTLAVAAIIVDYLAYDILSAAFQGPLGASTDIAQYVLAAHAVLTVGAVGMMFSAPVSQWLNPASAES